MFGFSTPEILVFVVVVLVLFGKRIPAAMRSMGEGLREFKKGIQASDSDTELVDAR